MKKHKYESIKKKCFKILMLTTISFIGFTYNGNAQPCGVLSPSWCILGNTGTTSANFIGTINPEPLIFKTTETEWMRIDPLGNVGIGTPIPQANFEVKNGSVLFDGTIGNTPVNGAGTRMMWVPSKGAFRAGAVNYTQWDNANIGLYSAAFGYSTTAESYACFVVGRFNRNSASYSKTAWVPTDPVFVVGIGANSEKSGNALTVLKNGNVGVATPTPVNRFDVSGAISIGGGYGGVKTAPANGAIIRGNVGIGTPTPMQTLDVNGRINVTKGVIQKGGAAITNTNDMGLYSLDPNTWMRFVTNGQPMRFYSDGGIGTVANMTIAANGNVGIGTDFIAYDDTYKLAVNGAIRAKRAVVELGWSDFVFEKNYKLKTLEYVEDFIKTNGHLPEIPSAKEIGTNGGDVGELLKLQMQKIEELTLYAIEQNKKIEELSKQIKSLKK